MEFLTKLFAPHHKTNVELIIEAYEQAVIDKRDCIFIAVTSPEYTLPLGRCDVDIRREEFIDGDDRIDYANHMMAVLSDLGYYASVMDGNKTDRAFSVLFVMVE